VTGAGFAAALAALLDEYSEAPATECIKHPQMRDEKKMLELFMAGSCGALIMDFLI
jgi:hypothetical protein